MTDTPSDDTEPEQTPDEPPHDTSRAPQQQGDAPPVPQQAPAAGHEGTPGQHQAPQGQQPQQPQQVQQQTQPRQAGPSITDIFSRHDTMQAMKTVIGSFALIGIGTGISGYALVGKYMGGDNLSSGLIGGVIALATLAAIAITGPGIAGVLAIVVDNGLEDLTDQLRYATAAVNGLGGFLVYALLAAVIISLKSNSGNGDAVIEIGDLIITLATGGVGAALASAGALFIQDKLSAPDVHNQPHHQTAD